MDFDNFVTALRSQHSQRPFRQYKIELSSGTDLRVAHPDVLARPGRRARVLSPDGLSHQFDPDSVVRITSLSEPAKKAGPSITI